MPPQDPNFELDQELANLHINESEDHAEQAAPAAQAAAGAPVLFMQAAQATEVWRYETPPPTEPLSPKAEATPAEFFHAQGVINRRNEALLTAISNNTITPAQAMAERTRLDAAQQSHDEHKTEYKKRARYLQG